MGQINSLPLREGINDTYVGTKKSVVKNRYTLLQFTILTQNEKFVLNLVCSFFNLLYGQNSCQQEDRLLYLLFYRFRRPDELTIMVTGAIGTAMSSLRHRVEVS